MNLQTKPRETNMKSHLQDIVTECTRASDESRMSFPEVVGTLMKAGVERYYTDLTRSEKIYYLPDGDNIAISARPIDVKPANEFNAAGVEAAIRAIQTGTISYHEFCRQIMEARQLYRLPQRAPRGLSGAHRRSPCRTFSRYQLIASATSANFRKGR
jgi:uncharacterized protein YbcV (DUF1398 family)